MSAIIETRAIDLLWKQWTALGVAGIATSPKQAVDLEALIAFTPFVASVDPRLAEESIDWCARIGKSFVSVSRLRQILRMMPPRTGQLGRDLASILIDSSDSSDLNAHRLSHKSRRPSLDHPSLLQLRSRYIFGVGARADVVSRLAMQGRVREGQRTSEIRPSGYTRAAISAVLDELAQAGVIRKLHRSTSVRYELTKEAPLRALLAPLPRRVPPWAERFSIIASILEVWRAFGSRTTYPIELAKVLDDLRPQAAVIGQRPPPADPRRLVRAVDGWATNLLEDDAWEDSWIVNGEDVAPSILDLLNDGIVRAVHAEDYPVGHTELSDFEVRILDGRAGKAQFVVQFIAEHPSEGFTFDGHVEGTFSFNPSASRMRTLLGSISLEEARAHFDMGDPGVAESDRDPT